MKRFAFILPALLVLACAGPSASHKKDLNDKLAAKNYGAAVAQIDQKMDDEYGKSSEVLYLLDKGAVLHFAGRFAESDMALDKAELKIDELYTKSVTQAVGQYISNDNTTDYRGRAYEKVLLHLLRALNSTMMNKPDEAVVEAKRMSAFLAQLGDGSINAGSSYNDDLLAHVLSQLVLEDAGRTADVDVSKRLAANAATKLKTAQAGATGAAAQTKTKALKTDLDPTVFEAPMGPNEGEIILVHYNGPGARIDSVHEEMAFGKVIPFLAGLPKEVSDPIGAALKTYSAENILYAMPTYSPDPFRIVGSKVFVNGKEACSTQLAEDLSGMAFNILQDNYDAIKTRAVIRGALKFVAAKVVEEQAKKQGGALGSLASSGAKAGIKASEIADTRIWSTMPSEIRLGHSHVQAGLVDVKVVYVDKNGKTVMEEAYPKLTVNAGKRTYVPVRTML